MQTQLKQIILILLISLFIFNACDETGPTPDHEPTKATEYVYEIFKDWYLWYNHIPNIDPKQYNNVDDFVEAIRYKAIDRWSFTASYTELMNYYQNAEYEGFGAGFIYDYDGSLKITMVYNNSPMGRAGVQRGWAVKKLNNVDFADTENVNKELNEKSTIKFEMVDLQGSQHSLSITKDVVVINSVLYSDVIELPQHKVGYVVFDSFIDTSEYELNSVFSDFKTQNINELIVDLRYNGGGNVSTALFLTSLIGGDKVNNQEIAREKHNDKHQEEDKSFFAPDVDYGLNIDRVFFITSSQTASASEMVINNLTPFMQVNLVGNTTHGKPVGMYVFHLKEFDLAVLPICFKNSNIDGYGDYYNGFPVDVEEVDDLSKAWGDVNESRLKTTLNLIEPEVVAAVENPLKSQQVQQQYPLLFTGIKTIIQAY